MNDTPSRATLPDWLKTNYPFRNHYLLRPMGWQHFLDQGQGRPILMLHGNPTWSFFYRELVKKLQSERRCIVPDHMGCGLSDRPQAWDYRLQGHIDNVLAILDHLKIEQFDLVVHDWGGAIGMGVATQMPDRVGRITILNTAAFRSQRIPWRIAICKTPLIGEFLVRQFNAFAGAAAHMAVTRPMPKSIRKSYLFPYGNWLDRIATHRFVADIPLKPIHPSYPTLLKIEESLEVLKDKPMSIHWGMKDFCFNKHFLDEWKRRFPEAKSHEYRDAGHYLMEDQPLVTEDICQFLLKPVK